MSQYLRSNKNWRCPGCNFRVPIDDNDVRIACFCGLTTDLTEDDFKGIRKDAPVFVPPMPVRLRNYTSAMARWVAAGRPLRSPEEIDHILENHCKACHYYKDGICAHGMCGCKLNSRRNGVFNKIAAATESCPLGKWQATGDTPAEP